MRLEYAAATDRVASVEPLSATTTSHVPSQSWAAIASSCSAKRSAEFRHGIKTDKSVEIGRVMISADGRVMSKRGVSQSIGCRLCFPSLGSVRALVARKYDKVLRSESRDGLGNAEPVTMIGPPDPALSAPDGAALCSLSLGDLEVLVNPSKLG